MGNYIGEVYWKKCKYDDEIIKFLDEIRIEHRLDRSQCGHYRRDYYTYDVEIKGTKLMFRTQESVEKEIKKFYKCVKRNNSFDSEFNYFDVYHLPM